MTNALEKALIGKRVVDVVYVHDYVQLVFDGGARLSIYNRHTANLSEVVGEQVTGVHVFRKTCEIEFSISTKIIIGMTDEDYCGPEAFSFFDPATGNIIAEQ